ncbi:MAG: hypothetical protein RR358_06005 [Cetobacterium sp.]
MKTSIEKLYTMEMREKEFELIASSLKRGAEERYVKSLQLETASSYREKDRDKIKILQRELFDSLQAYEAFTGEKHDMHEGVIRIRRELGV